MKILFYIIILGNYFLFSVAQHQSGHVIPEQKNIPDEWLESYRTRGEQKVYKGDELLTIGMPCGGIAAGQLYVRGDGTLAGWWIANNAYNTGNGIDKYKNFQTALGPWKTAYQTYEPISFIEQGFTLSIKTGKKQISRSLSKKDFNDISFIGEYPIATITYNDTDNPLPTGVSLDVFSPFIPLNSKESAMPVTILRFTLRNTSSKPLEVELSGYLQNMVMLDLKDSIRGEHRNRVIRDHDLSSLYMDFIEDESSISGMSLLADNIRNHAYYGNMTLSLLHEDGEVFPDLGPNKSDTKPIGKKLTGGVACSFKLNPGGIKQVTYLLTWYFPNRPASTVGDNWNKAIDPEGVKVGNMYSNWFSSSLDVARYVNEHFTRLTEETYLFRDTYYHASTLPYWLLQRIMMPVSNLATETCQWWATDKFWGWEGVGSCLGTCTHVWNYVQALSRLFPDLEKNIRERTDFSTSFREDGGIFTRNGTGDVFMDGHAGTILKSYREYLISDNIHFLSRNWDKIKKATEYLITQDENEDGLIENEQWNTYDVRFWGANTFVGGLYLAALRAAEKMALIMDDVTFAEKCKDIYTSGSKLSVEKLWNGKYFIQEVDTSKYPWGQYVDGCLSDQLFGQTWAHQFKLGYIYPEENVKKTLSSIWKYNWTLDVGEHNALYTPMRYLSHKGEPGLINCTWPYSKHLDKMAVLYRNETWIGVEYQVATNMIYEGMIDEGLSIVRAVHERYNPVKHNPWNEINAGDHYIRALASWGVLIALEDFYYDGNNRILSFNPKIQQDNFTGFFTGSRGWGTIKQQRTNTSQKNTVTIRWGELTLKELILGINIIPSEVTLTINGSEHLCDFELHNDLINITFEETTINRDNEIVVFIR